MQHLEVSGAVGHIYIYVIRRLKVNTFICLTLVNTANTTGETRRCSGYLMHSGKSEIEIMPSNRLRVYYYINF